MREIVDSFYSIYTLRNALQIFKLLCCELDWSFSWHVLEHESRPNRLAQNPDFNPIFASRRHRIASPLDFDARYLFHFWCSGVQEAPSKYQCNGDRTLESSPALIVSDRRPDHPSLQPLSGTFHVGRSTLWTASSLLERRH